MPEAISKPNKNSDGRSVFIHSTTGRFDDIYVDWKLLFDLVRQFAFVEEMKRQGRLVKESRGFEGAKRIARLCQYAAGRRFDWDTVRVKLGMKR